MKKFILKLFLFTLPLVMIVFYFAYQILVLPIDYYTFRAWEALKVYENAGVLSGPFYPNYHLVKTEFGDLSGLSKVPVAKHVEWFTDSYGYRKKSEQKKYEIVVLGDSAIAGSGLTQEDMYTEKLGRNLKVSAYPFAPSNFNKFLDDNRFDQNPPDMMIFESVEKLVLHIPEIIPKDQRQKKKSFENKLFEKIHLSSGIITDIAIKLDILRKNSFINYLYARFSELPSRIISGKTFSHRSGVSTNIEIPDGIPEMVFYSEPEDYFKDWQQVYIDRVVMILKGYQEELAKRGTKFVFMPIPNKENIYWELVSGGRENNNLKRLIQTAEAEGIVTVDLLSVYKNIHKNKESELLYHLDDSHWNPHGVSLAVEQTLDTLKEKKLITW